MKIAIAGASGFIGKKLSETLSHQGHSIIGMSRTDKPQRNEKVSWVRCDLYSMLDLEKALEGVDTAVYLVHSMLPSARLMQGKFEDYDLILADNFARVCKRKNVKKIIYLGGIIPSTGELSAHLKSRKEVEDTLRAYGTPVISLRAGIIIGPEGSSYTMMSKLVQRLPILICPAWTSTLSSPIYIDDVIKSLDYVINKVDSDAIYDIGGKDEISYKDMLELTAKELGLKRHFFSLSLFSPGLSKLWVSTFTGAPKELVYPLIQSLKHSMVPDPEKELKDLSPDFLSFKESLEKTINTESQKSPHAYKFTGNKWSLKDVRSVQRLKGNKAISAKEIADEYMLWLPKFFSSLITVEINQNTVYFKSKIVSRPLLILERSLERSSPDRQLFYIKGGLLAAHQERGRLEFRSTTNGEYKVAAIHEFRPSLPWFIYKYTQAPVHEWVMYKFNQHLKNLKLKVNNDVKEKS